jgi:hypothetical protein
LIARKHQGARTQRLACFPSWPGDFPTGCTRMAP